MSSDREEMGLIAASLRSQLQRGWQCGIGLLSGGQTRDNNPGSPGPLKELEGFEGELFPDYGAAFDAQSLEELRAAVGDCRRCKLWPGRTHLVFGVGHPRADIMFVGEGPGRDEDLQGEPFVGRAGKLLTDIITKGMKLRREDVYIANVIKCRPPDNRNPEPDELKSCEPFLVKQIEMIKPRVIIGLGKFAVQCLLKSKVLIMRLRGVWHDYHGIKFMPTLHPAYLLRNPGDKKLVWQDIKKVLEELDLPTA
ncbi:MAG: uracil-DNA glycosylase [Candidatus Binatia bacterium]|nr:uracil-DNA glycosylase [Candidatus Binatia bacterium]